MPKESMQFLLFVVAFVVLTFQAIKTFTDRTVIFADAPAVPRVLAGRLKFQIGLATFWLIVVAAYVALTSHWGPFKQTFGPILKKAGIPEEIVGVVQSGADPSMDVWLAAIFLAWLIPVDNKYNPFLIVLDGLLLALHIPHRATTVYEMLKSTKFGRPNSAFAREICTHDGIEACEPGYFEKNRRDLEYRWAHVCYLRNRLLTLAKGRRYHRHVAEKTLNWPNLHEEYEAAAMKVRVWTIGPRDYRDAADILADISKLKLGHYRILASFAVSTFTDEQKLWAWISNLSQAPVRSPPRNLLRYLALVLPTIPVAVILGYVICTIAYQRVFDPSATLDEKSMRLWALLCTVIYAAPIGAVLVGRWLFRERKPFEARAYWGIYLFVFGATYVLAVAAIPALLALAGIPSGRAIFSWAALPAFVAALVAFRLDCRALYTDPARTKLKDRAMAALVTGAAGLIVASCSAYLDHFSFEKAFIVTGTVTLMTFCIGLVSRFELATREVTPTTLDVTADVVVTSPHAVVQSEC